MSAFHRAGTEPVKAKKSLITSQRKDRRNRTRQKTSAHNLGERVQCIVLELFGGMDITVNTGVLPAAR